MSYKKITDKFRNDLKRAIDTTDNSLVYEVKRLIHSFVDMECRNGFDETEFPPGFYFVGDLMCAFPDSYLNVHHDTAKMITRNVFETTNKDGAVFRYARFPTVTDGKLYDNGGFEYVTESSSIVCVNFDYIEQKDLKKIKEAGSQVHVSYVPFQCFEDNNVIHLAEDVTIDLIDIAGDDEDDEE